MPELIPHASRVEAAGTPPKLIDEFVGHVNTGEERLSVARMRSPEGWREPGQRPEFDEYTLVLAGCLRIEHEGGALDVRADQAVLVRAGEWVRYSSPEPGGAEYVAVCLPAFTLGAAGRDDEA
jgi:mannose-6-phosphate isomerase-like protein (cupin superfamily)